MVGYLGRIEVGNRGRGWLSTITVKKRRSWMYQVKEKGEKGTEGFGVQIDK